MYQLVFFLFVFIFGAQSAPRQPFSHEGIGYALLNHTVSPVPDGCTINSVNEVSSVISSCTNINVGSFSVPAGNQPLILNLKSGTCITFTGQITFARNEVNGYMMHIIGSNILVQGSSTHLFNGQGEQYWDGKGGAGCAKPTFMYLKGTSSTFNGLHLKNCPERCVALDGSNNVVLSSFLIDNREGAPGTAASGKEGHNTDGFDVAKSQYVTIKNSVVYNQDDCVAINNGAHMLIDSVNCDGSHGFDIATGMSTSDQNLNIVNNITFQNSNLYNGMVGLHILTCSDGGSGYVSNVYYNNIKFSGPSDYGIIIQQDFSNANQGSSGYPTANVPISNVVYNNIQGSMNGKYSYALALRCASYGCSGIALNSVTITNAKSANECWNYVLSGWC